MNDVKFISVAMIIVTMIALAVLKCFLKDVDISQINTVLLSVLSGLGYHSMTNQAKDELK